MSAFLLHGPYGLAPHTAVEWWSALTPRLRFVAFVFAVLALATVVVGVARWRLGARVPDELVARVRAWWVMAALVLGALLAGRGAAIVLFALVSFWALKEFYTLLETRRADHRALFWSFLAIPIQYAWAWTHWYGMFIVFIPVYMFLFLPIRLVLAGETRGFVASVAQLQWGLMAFVFGQSHLGFLAGLPPSPALDGRSLVMFLLFVIEISDVMQYVWGKLAGRHKIIPAISPNKTWEGFAGGIASATLASLAVRFLTPFPVGETLGVALLVCVVGFFGGAVMSAVKRDFGVKDFGASIPGHGGVLDRVDSLCFAAPVFFHYVRYVHHF
ncbi:MAG TPA: phosphatidate cytidylyltransferase [Candidatus Eisenbacteria bacterium]|nr:phosphatidate cytidylyltransferase [Candidatus Eisenbacteria bacterium]